MSETVTEPFESKLAIIAARVETVLAEWLQGEPAGGEVSRPERLLQAMRHSALGGGKRLRPFLTVEAASLFGDYDEAALRVGSAIELVHCYSLVHDDLPAMDDDALRRGRPTVHVAFDEATAILAGDGLLTLAFGVMASSQTHPDAIIRADLVAGLACASGIGGMLGGQMLDLAAEGRYGPVMPDETSISEMQGMKTGALFSFCAEAGGIVAGASSAHRVCLRRYGAAFGRVFQIADDLLDREATAGALGKHVGKDTEKGKATLIDQLGLTQAREERDRLIETAISSLEEFGREADGLREAARFAASRAT